MAATADVTYIHPQTESAGTLGTIVELVRRIMHADVASILSYSLVDDTVTWKAASGFVSPDIDYQQPVHRPLAVGFARDALEQNTVVIFNGIGQKPELPAESFPVHSAEGVHDLAVAPLRIQGTKSGALTAGYRAPHRFTDEEKTLLHDLAEMASLVMDNAYLSETVRAAEEIWKQTFEAIGEGILVYDSQGLITRCNASAAEMIDLPIDEVVGSSFTDAFGKLFGKRAADYYLADNHGASTVTEVQTECGRRFLFSMFPVRQPGGALGTVATWKDVTRLSEIQEQLGRSQRLASVGQLAAGVAHEVNNPLAAITTCAEAILRDMQRSQSAKQFSEATQWNYYLEEIVRQTLRCKEITRGLLDLTRQRRAKRVLCDINMIVKECGKVAAQHAQSNVEFNIELDEHIADVATDAEMVRQIIDNLLKNAIDAMGDQKGKITVSTQRDADRVTIEVADSGSGIAPEVLPRIFDPFFSTKSRGKGYGLGLAISLSLAESLGGGINVESKPGAGSRFRLRIPRRAPEQ